MAQATLYKTLEGHTNKVYSVAFSPDDKLIASASADNTVRLWSFPSGDFNVELKGHENLVSSVAFSPDGKSIVTGSWDKTVQTWSVSTKQQVHKLNGHSNWVWSVAWSPNGDLIASGSQDKTVILWDATSGSTKKTLTGHEKVVWSVSFSQNGNKLASAGDDKTVIIWDVTSGAALIKLAHSHSVNSVCFSPDDQFVVTGCADGIVRMFNTNTGLEEKRFKGHTSSVNSVAISFDGSMLASGGGSSRVFFDGTSIVGGRSLFGGGSSVRLWDVASTKQLQKLDGHTNDVFSVAFSRDGKFIASGSVDRTVRLWNASSILQEIERLKREDEEKRVAEENQLEEAKRKAEKERLSKVEEEKRVAEENLVEEKRKAQEKEKAKQKAKNDRQAKNPADWTIDEVCAWIEELEFDSTRFRADKIRGKILKSCATHDFLKEMDFTAIGDRIELIDAINQLFSSTSSVNPGFKVYEIPRRELTKDIKLSEGNFGIVWRGTFTGIPVAIKEPKMYGAKLNPKKQVIDLVEEATMMTGISAHPNVLHCYGISRVGEDDYLLVTELCSLGSLESFLRAYPGTPAVDRRRFSQQVARGLNHLGKHNVAHRDVAARNVLLHDQGGGVIVAKVCDFGLSRQREGEYYLVTGEHLVSPETAPEVFNTGKHSTRSDVWSFGVLLWEVESLCASRAIPDTQAFPPLSKPAQASDNMYEIMLKCWAKDPHQRPSFEALVDLLA